MTPARHLADDTGSRSYRLQVFVDHDRLVVHGEAKPGFGARSRRRRALEACLGRAEAVENHQVRQVLEELRFDRLREDRPGRAQREPRREVALPVEGFGQRPGHSVAHEADRVDLLLLDELQGRRPAVLRKQHDLLAPVERDQRPELRGTVHQRRRREHHHDAALHCVGCHLLGLLHRLALRVAATQSGEEQILMAPHHALGHARGSAGVDDVDVVGRAFDVEAIGRLGGQRRFVFVFDHHDVLELGGPGRLNAVSELPVDQQRDEFGVVVQVAEFLGDVAEVHVDRHGADLEGGEDAFKELNAVEELKADVVGLGRRLLFAGGAPVGSNVHRVRDRSDAGRRTTKASRSPTASATDSKMSARLNCKAHPPGAAPPPPIASALAGARSVRPISTSCCVAPPNDSSSCLLNRKYRCNG